MQHEVAERRVGTWLRAKYRLDALIGVGGMAAVYRGAHRNGNRVAVKVLHAALSVHTDIRARFLKEGYVANSVGHPGAVRVLDDDVTEDGAVFIVMELLEGETLEAHRLHGGKRLPAKEVAELAIQVLSVLAAAHDKSIVHRDIKPENLFLTREGQVKVLDFGIARMRDGASAMTLTGRMLGSPAYMPREQALGLTKEIDGRTDLWAVGATMFTLLSGVYVHEAETPESMMVWTATRPARSLASVAPEVPVVLVNVVDRALSFAMADRFADARSMIAALDLAHRAIDRAESAPPVAATRASAGHDAPETALDGTQRAPSVGPSASVVPPVAVVAIPPPTPSFVALASVAPSISAAAAMSGYVSTTAGVSSKQKPLFAPPLYGGAMGSAPPAGRGRQAALLAVAGLMMVVVLGVGATLLYRARLGPVPTRVSAPVAAVSEQAGVATAAALPLPVPTATAAPSPAAVADAEAPVVAAVVAPAHPRDAGTAVRVKAAPAATVPDCNPPVYYDSRGQKKVKPGC